MTTREQQDTRYWLTAKGYAALDATPPAWLTDSEREDD